jgi:Reverse transcriptase (RNA-dependent DNA polymerase)
VAGAIAQLVMVCHVDTGYWALPAGAPASTALFNLVCLRIDRAIEKWLIEQGEGSAVYTRYVDDMVFSRVSRETMLRLPEAVATILEPFDFQLNADKTRQMDGHTADVYRLRRHRGRLGLTAEAHQAVVSRIRRLRDTAADTRQSELVRRTAGSQLQGIAGFVQLVYGPDNVPGDLHVPAPAREPAPLAATIDDLWL